MNFEKMNRFKKWFSNWRKQFKFAVYDPQNFNEIFGITTSKIRIVSLFILTIFIVSILLVFLLKWSPLGNYVMNASSPEQKQIIEQRIRVDSLSKKLDAQEKYIDDLKLVLFGKIQPDTIAKRPEVQIDPSKINPNPGKAELQISENVKADQYTNSSKQTSSDFVHFISPVKGKISQRFVSEKHEALDIVTPLDAYFSACLGGTVVFSGYSQKDGNIIILEHPNDFLSIYKHAKTILKKRGDKVRAGDMIGIVGNTGENSTGPHLHFELWLNQQAVNPQKYMIFE